MTLTCYEFSKFRGMSLIWEPAMAKRMKTDPYIVSDGIVAH